MEKHTIAVYVIAVARRRLRRNPLDLAGRKLDTKKNRTVICAALRVYILVK
jgi:hypothetical protein